MIVPWKKWMFRVASSTALAAALVAAGRLHAEEPRDEIARWMDELASRDFAARQRASRGLEQAGRDAMPRILAAAASADAEVRSRAMAIILAHARSPRAELRELGRSAIGKLVRSDDPRIAGDGLATLRRFRESMSLAATTDLTRLGATVMPVQTAAPLTFNVQIGQGWTGGDERLAALADLGQVPWLSLESAPLTDAALVHIGKLDDPTHGLTQLFLGNTQITGSGLRHLPRLGGLQYLSLKQLPVDDAKLALLPELAALRYLGLDGTKISDEGLKTVARYSQLQVLWLDQTRVTDAGLAHLKTLDNLRTLYLPGTNTAGPGLADLRRLPNLTSLSLKGTKLSADSLKYVAQLEQLESLGLDQTNVSDEQLVDLAGLHRLRVLWLSGTRISDAGLAPLKSLVSLQVLYLSDSQVSPREAAQLQQALPNCQVIASGQAERRPPAAVPPPGALPTGRGP